MKWEGKTKLNLQSPKSPDKRIFLTGDLADLVDYVAMGQREARRDTNIIRALRNIEYWNKVLETVT